jgi:hypothetical protein
MALPPISPTGVASAFIYPRQTKTTGTGISGQLSANPGVTNAPLIFEPPSALSGGQMVVWIIATGYSANWGGCTVFASIDGTTYTRIGTILSGGIQGRLTAEYPMRADPDVIDTLSVGLGMSQSQLIAGTQQDADDFLTLCHISTSAVTESSPGVPITPPYELIAYSNATLTGANQYNLDTYIRRGCYGTPILDHLTGYRFGRIVGSTFAFTFPPNFVGKAIFFKFPAFNIWGGATQALSAATQYGYSLTGIGLENTNQWFLPFSVGGTFSILSTDSWDGNYEIFDIEMPVAVGFPANFATSPTPGCETAPGGAVTLTFQTIHAGTPTTVGTMTIAAGATTGTYLVSSGSGFTVPKGDRLRCYAPSGVDTTIAGLFGTLIGLWPASPATPAPPPSPPVPRALRRRPWLLQQPEDGEEWTPTQRGGGRRWRPS